MRRAGASSRQDTAGVPFPLPFPLPPPPMGARKHVQANVRGVNVSPAIPSCVQSRAPSPKHFAILVAPFDGMTSSMQQLVRTGNRRQASRLSSGCCWAYEQKRKHARQPVSPQRAAIRRAFLRTDPKLSDELNPVLSETSLPRLSRYVDWHTPPLWLKESAYLQTLPACRARISISRG